MSKHLRPKYMLMALLGAVFAIFVYSSTFANTYTVQSVSVPVNGEVSRSISPDDEWVGSNFTITYRFSLEAIVSQLTKPNINSYQYVEWDATIRETIPAGFELSNPLPTGFTFNQSTRLLEGKIEIICGKKNSGAEESCKDFVENDAFKQLSIPLKATLPGKFNFNTAQYGYSFYAEHSGNAMKHDRNVESAGVSFGSKGVNVKGANLSLPASLTLYMKDESTIKATLDGKLPEGAKLSWEVVQPGIVKQSSSQSTNLAIQAIGVGETKVRVTYTYPNGFNTKSGDMIVTVKLPDLSLSSNKQELWVYVNQSGQLIKQEATLDLAQLTTEKQPVGNPLDVTWSVNSSALKLLSSQNTTATVQAEHGSTGNVSITAKLKDYIGQTMPVLINVKEYPQKVSTPNVILYMTDSPYSYPVKFWPETANVTGYGLTVLEGNDVMTAKDGVLTLLKPGIAKVGLVTQDVSASFKAGDGPEVISQTFFVRVKAGTDPNPGTKDPSGDFY